MERHITQFASINASIPATMRKLTAKEIVAKVSRIEFAKAPSTTKSVGLRMIEAASKAVFSPDDWKMPIYATFPQDADGRNAIEWVKAAIIWYHGSEPLESSIGVYSQGYAC